MTKEMIAIAHIEQICRMIQRDDEACHLFRKRIKIFLPKLIDIVKFAKDNIDSGNFIHNDESLKNLIEAFQELEKE
jgi:hypothetical protein